MYVLNVIMLWKGKHILVSIDRVYLDQEDMTAQYFETYKTYRDNQVWFASVILREQWGCLVHIYRLTATSNAPSLLGLRGGLSWVKWYVTS